METHHGITIAVIERAIVILIAESTDGQEDVLNILFLTFSIAKSGELQLLR